jgi:actin-like ATPase involved in cell morphogenesis
MTVIGLDVGYSNLKIAVGGAGAAPRVMVRPAGSAPLDRLGERVGTGRRQDAVIVDVDGQRWAAAVEVGSVALETLRQSLRREATTVDLVVVTGGGGALYGCQAAERFPGAQVRLARDPVGANARGFFRYGQR